MRSRRGFIWLTFFLLFVWGATVVVVQADGEDGDGTGGVGSGSPRLRVVHASPDAPNVDYYVDGALFFGDRAYRTVSEYKFLTSGEYIIRASVATVDRNVETPLELYEDGRDYTLVLLGRLGESQLKRFMDDNRSPDVGKARVRLIHASPPPPEVGGELPVDVCVTGGDCFALGLTFGNETQYFDFNAGSYSFDVRLAGTDTVVFNEPDLRFDSGVVYTLFALGVAGGGEPQLQIIRAVDTGRPPVLPPTTGAFLSPTLLVFIMGMVLILVGGGWIVRRQFMVR